MINKCRFRQIIFILLSSTSKAFLAHSPSRCFRPLFQRNSDRVVYEINRAMDDLAEKCGDIKQPVVSLASQVEDIYRQAKEKDIVSFNVMLKAWSKACHSLERQKHGNQNGIQITNYNSATLPIYTPRDAAEHLTKQLLSAEEACQKNKDSCLIVPDETSYNIAIDAWAKSQTPDATQAAERLLGKMMENPRLEPSSISYNAVLDSHAHSSDPESLTRMTKIWNHMQREADKGTTKVRPNLRTINTILTAFVRNVDMNKDPEVKMGCAVKARNFFDDIQKRDERSDLTPDIMSYSILMDAFARVGSTEAALQAEALMQELKEAYQKSGDIRLKPNFRTYTTLISAWSRTYDPNAAQHAEALLMEMEEMYKKSLSDGKPLAYGEETTKPNARTFTYVIQAISRSHDNNKAKRVLKILKKMREEAKTSSDCAPFLSTYNHAIDACSKTRGEGKHQVEALKIAFAILKTMEIDPNVQPNDVAYNNILKAVGFLLPDSEERNQIARAAFDKAKANGMISVDVIRSVRKAMDNKTMRETLHPLEIDSGSIEYSKIPNSWCKNVLNR